MYKSEAHERLVDEILVALSATGLCRVWRNPTGAAYRGTQLIRYGKKGSADITGILKGGRRLEIECKTGAAVQNLDQKHFGEMINNLGGLYIVGRDIETVVKIIKATANV